MKARHFLAGTLSALALTGLVGLASASSHREAPAIGFDPAATTRTPGPGSTTARTTSCTSSPRTTRSRSRPAPELQRVLGRRPLRVPHHARQQEPRGRRHYQVQFSSTDIQRVDVADLKAPSAAARSSSRSSPAAADLLAHQADHEKGGKVRREVLGQGLPVAPVNIGPNTNKIVYNTPKYDEAFMGKFINPLGFNGNQGRVYAGRPTTASTSTSAASSTSRTSSAHGARQRRRLQLPLDRPGKSRPLRSPRTVSPQGRRERRQHDRRLGLGEPPAGPRPPAWRGESELRLLGPGLAPRLPLVNGGGHRPPGKDKYNRTKPAKDVANFGAYFLNPVIVFLDEGPAAGRAGCCGLCRPRPMGAAGDLADAEHVRLTCASWVPGTLCFDLVFIDGEHTADAVERDTANRAALPPQVHRLPRLAGGSAGARRGRGRRSLRTR